MEQAGQRHRASRREWPERFIECGRLVPASRLTMLCRRCAEGLSRRAEMADRRPWNRTCPAACGIRPEASLTNGVPSGPGSVNSVGYRAVTVRERVLPRATRHPPSSIRPARVLLSKGPILNEFESEADGSVLRNAEERSPDTAASEVSGVISAGRVRQGVQPCQPTTSIY